MLKQTLLSVFAAASLLSFSHGAQAQLSFNVNISIGNALNFNPNAPFFLDFQLIQGGALVNTASLSNFTFAGGAPSGSANLTGDSTGDLSSSVTLKDDTSSFEEFYQQFTSTTTSISFKVTLTGNVNPTADQFLVAILDSSSGFNPQVTTTAPDTVSLVSVPIDRTLSISEAAAYATTSGSTAPGISASTSPVPEPSAFVGMLGGLALLASRRPRRA